MGPLEGKTDNCEALPPPPGQCCPAEYKCGEFSREILSVQGSRLSLFQKGTAKGKKCP